jgi:hypothetical protein
MTPLRPRGGWIDIPPAPEHFQSWPPDGWPVEEQEVLTYAYRLDEDMLFLQFVLDNTSVRFDVAELYLALPRGYAAVRTSFQFFQALNASPWGEVGTARVHPGDNVVRFQATEAGAGWAASDHQTCVRGLFIVQVAPTVVKEESMSRDEKRPDRPSHPDRPSGPDRPDRPDGPDRPEAPHPAHPIVEPEPPERPEPKR